MANIWEEIFQKEESILKKSHPEIAQITQLFTEENIKRILDLGCGRGRHIVYLASRGFDVYGLDITPTGLADVLQVLSKKGLTAHITLHDMVTLPWDDEYFDAIISIQVIHHNKLQYIIKTVEEIIRVLKKGGLIWITLPVSKQGIGTNFEEIEPQIFVPLNGREKGCPIIVFQRRRFLNYSQGVQSLTFT